MQLLHTLAATAALLAAVASPVALATSSELVEQTTPNELVEPTEVKVSNFFTAVVVTSVADKRNYANEFTQPICVSEVTRVREAVYNGTRDMFIEVKGCSIDKARGLCGAEPSCPGYPFEVNVVGPQTTPGFDPVTTMLKGKPVKTPYTIRSIGLLL